MRFGLLGNNISYSYSKKIHEFVFKYYNLDYTYDIFDINPINLDEFFNNFKNGNIQGINVTIPYKESVIKYLDEIDPHALELGNVNTIINKNGRLIGYNTDYYGFDYLLKYYNILPTSSDNIYILGTGGAAKTVYNVMKKYSNNLSYVSRDKIEYNIISYNELEKRNVNYLINCTPMGDKNHINDLLVSNKKIYDSNVVIDLIYNPRKTKLLSLSKNGYNGLIMLFYQALKADNLFINKDIDYKILIEKLGDLFE